MRAILVCEENRAAIVEDSMPMWKAEEAEKKAERDVTFGQVTEEDGSRINVSATIKSTPVLDPEMLVTIHGNGGGMYYIHGYPGDDLSETDFYYYESEEVLCSDYVVQIPGDKTEWFTIARVRDL